MLLGTFLVQSTGNSSTHPEVSPTTKKGNLHLMFSNTEFAVIQSLRCNGLKVFPQEIYASYPSSQMENFLANLLFIASWAKEN